MLQLWRASAEKSSGFRGSTSFNDTKTRKNEIYYFMKDDSQPMPFIFNARIDGQFLYRLYENDYQYIAEVFKTALENFKEDLAPVKEAYLINDPELLRKSVHKLKPVFGYTGLLHIQDSLEVFENGQLQNFSPELLANVFKELMKSIEEGKEIMEEEQKRLIQFIQTRNES